MADTVTIRDVARRAEVSVGTVSNYLNRNKRITPGTTARIEQAISDLGFIPNVAVRVMRGRRSPVLGFVVPDATNPFFTEIGRGVEDVAFIAGLVVVTCNTHGDEERERHYMQALTEMRVAGVLVTPMSPFDDQLDKFAESGGTVVLIDEPPRTSNFSSISVDDLTGAEMAVSHLLDLGHRDILFVGGPAGPRQITDRYTGALKAIQARADEGLTLRRFDASGTTTEARGAVADHILQEPNRPTAVFCANDLIALAVQGALQRRGLTIPDDIAIIGYDDIPSAQLASPPLSSVRQPQYDLGRQAAELVLREAAGSSSVRQHTVLQTELVARESTTPIQGQPRNSGVRG